ncbi:MAG: DUF4320 family protein [Rikenellaceae bacterium]|uniref:DUF4320 family protein n=1 Tax=Chakrabartyella piscis TaxID=2918914 RepID=UPI00295848E0|nr:DUF4320 family protein [Chakrabartyella piscis]
MFKILKNKRGEGYMDTVVLVLCAMLVIAMAVRVFPAYIAKQKVDTFATEILREAEIAGRIGAETTAAENKLCDDLGISPTVTWSDYGYIQLGDEITVTVVLPVEIGLFGDFGSFSIDLRSDASGKSEVYWK